MSDSDDFEEDIQDFKRWFHGVLSRPQAEQILTRQSKPYGFLVRKSARPQMQDYFILSVCLGNMTCNHYDIYCAYGVLSIGGYSYQDMRSILSYYHKNDIGDVGEKLGFPVPPVVEPIDPTEEYLKATKSYKSEEANILCFEKDDEFIKEPNGQEFEGLIYVSSLKSLTKGYVPSNCVEIHRRYPDFVSRLKYFHPNPMTIEQLVEIMSGYGDGSYLVRPSESQPGCYSLQGMYANRIRKFLITPRVMEDEGTSTMSDEENDKCAWGLEGSDVEEKDYSQRSTPVSKCLQQASSTKRIVFDTSSGVFPSIEAIVEFYTESDVYPGGVRLKTPIKYEEVNKLLNGGQEATNGVPGASLAHEQLYDAFRSRNLLMHYPHPDEAGVEFTDTLYLFSGKSGKKCKWSKYSCSLDNKNVLRLLLDVHPHKGTKQKVTIISLASSSYYTVDMSLHETPYCFLLAVPSVTDHRESVQYLLCVHDPKELKGESTPSSASSSSMFSTPNLSTASGHGLHNCTTASTVLSSSAIANTHQHRTNNLSASFASMQAIINNNSHSVTRFESLPPVRLNTIHSSNLERFLLWQTQLMQICVNTRQYTSTGPLRTVPSSEEHVREHHELLLNVMQLSGPTSLMKPHLMWCCQVHLGVPKLQFCAAKTAYENYTDEPREGDRRIVEWKNEAFTFENVPRNLDRLVFSFQKKNMKKNQGEQDYGNMITLQIKEIKPAWFPELRERTLEDTESMRLSISVSYHKLLIRQNISYYQPLIDVLMDHMRTDLVPLSDMNFSKCHLHACILRLAIRKGKVLDLIHELILYRTLANKDTEFIRKDNFVTSILRDYVIHSCVGWLRCVFAPLVQYLHQRYMYLLDHTPHSNNSSSGGISPSQIQGQQQNQSRRGVQRQPSISEEASSSTGDSNVFDMGDHAEQVETMFEMLLEGIKSSVETVPLCLRHMYRDQLDIWKKKVDQASSHLKVAATGSGDGHTEPVSPPSIRTQCPSESVFVANLLFLRIIAHSLSGGVNPVSLLHSAWVASASHPLRNMVEQLYALYDIRRNLDEDVSLIKITLEDRDLSEDEFLTKHFGSPCKVHPHRFPRKVFVKSLMDVAKRIAKSTKLDFLEKELSHEEALQLENSLKMETEACLKQPGWTQDMAEIEAILQYNHHKLEEVMADGHEYFSRLLKVLQQMRQSTACN